MDVEHMQLREQAYKALVEMMPDMVEMIVARIAGDKPISRMQRDQLIRQEFNGRNGCEIMRRYGVSRATLYRVTEAHKGKFEDDSP